jgi:hypothetical protein
MLTRSFADYLAEAAFAADQPVAGDVLYIELSETEIFECTVVENKSGTIIVEDSRLYETLDLTEELDDEEPDEDESEEDDDEELEDNEYLRWIYHGDQIDDGDQIDEDLNAIRRLSGYTNVSETSREKLEKYLVDLEADPNYPDYPTPEEFRKRMIGGGRAVAKLGGRGRNRIKVPATKEETELTSEAEYHGRHVELNKPMKGDVAKSKVYVKDPSTGNVKKVNFGDKNMRIKKSIPARRRSFRARHHCENPGPKTSARYWSCRAW